MHLRFAVALSAWTPVAIAQPIVLDFEEPFETVASYYNCSRGLGEAVESQGFLIGRARHRWSLQPAHNGFVPGFGAMILWSGDDEPCSGSPNGTHAIEDINDERKKETYITRPDGATFDLVSLDIWVRDHEDDETCWFVGVRPDGSLVAVDVLWESQTSGFETLETPELTGVQSVCFTGPFSDEINIVIDNMVFENVGAPAPEVRRTVIDFEALEHDGADDTDVHTLRPFHQVGHFRDGYVLGPVGESLGYFSVPGTNSTAFTGSTAIRMAERNASYDYDCDAIDTSMMISRMDGKTFGFRSMDLAFYHPMETGPVDLAIRVTFQSRPPETVMLSHTEPGGGSGPTAVRYNMADYFSSELEDIVSVDFGYWAAGGCTTSCGTPPPCGYAMQPFQFDNIVLDLGDVCVADVNSDGFVDFTDVIDFLVAFGAGELPADLDFSGTVDFTDIVEFLSEFAGGC